jgi:hypothetical protein
MTDTITTTAATKPNAAKHIAAPFGLPKDDIPNSTCRRWKRGRHSANTLTRVSLRRRNAAKGIQTTGNEMTAILEETYSTAGKGVTDYNLKLFEIARAQISVFLTLPASS